jgi:hypothetical protein
MQAVGDDDTTARERALHAFAVDAADRRREILALEGHRSLLYPVTGELIANPLGRGVGFAAFEEAETRMPR